MNIRVGVDILTIVNRIELRLDSLLLKMNLVAVPRSEPPSDPTEDICQTRDCP